MCRGALPFYQLLSLKNKVMEDTVTNSLAAWLTFDQISSNFERIGVRDAPRAPTSTSLPWNRAATKSERVDCYQNTSVFSLT